MRRNSTERPVTSEGGPTRPNPLEFFSYVTGVCLLPNGGAFLVSNTGSLMFYYCERYSSLTVESLQTILIILKPMSFSFRLAKPIIVPLETLSLHRHVHNEIRYRHSNMACYDLNAYSLSDGCNREGTTAWAVGMDGRCEIAFLCFSMIEYPRWRHKKSMKFLPEVYFNLSPVRNEFIKGIPSVTKFHSCHNCLAKSSSVQESISRAFF